MWYDDWTPVANGTCMWGGRANERDCHVHQVETACEGGRRRRRARETQHEKHDIIVFLCALISEVERERKLVVVGREVIAAKKLLTCAWELHIQPKICYIVQWKLFFIYFLYSCSLCAILPSLTRASELRSALSHVSREEKFWTCSRNMEGRARTVHEAKLKRCYQMESCIVSETILKIRINISFLSVSSVCLGCTRESSEMGRSSVGARRTCECVLDFFALICVFFFEATKGYQDISIKVLPKKKSFFLSSFPRISFPTLSSSTLRAEPFAKESLRSLVSWKKSLSLSPTPRRFIFWFENKSLG